MNLSFKHRPLQFDLMKYRIVLIKIKFLKSMDIFYCIDYNGVRNNFIFYEKKTIKYLEVIHLLK